MKWLAGTTAQHELLAAYYDTDLVLSCGGGNFYAYRSLSIAYLWSLATLWLALALGKRTILLPQSIGPVVGRFQRWLTRQVFKRPARILLREQQSAKFLTELGLNRESIVLADLAFALPSAADRLDLSDAGGAQLRIGVTVIDRGAQEGSFRQQAAYEEMLAKLLIQIHQEFQAHLYIFVQCYGPTPDQDDRRCARRLYERVRQETGAVTLMPDFQDALDIRAVYTQLDCLIGTRMHTGIFALSQAVPVVLIGYQPKALGTMALFGLEQYCLDITTMTDSDLMRLMRQLLEHRTTLSRRIAARQAGVQAILHNWPRLLQE